MKCHGMSRPKPEAFAGRARFSSSRARAAAHLASVRGHQRLHLGVQSCSDGVLWPLPRELSSSCSDQQ